MWTQISEGVLNIVKGNLMDRNSKGYMTYNETLDDVPFENYNWNVMAMEELLDGIQYLMKENVRLNQELQSGDNMNFNLYQEMSKRTMSKSHTSLETRFNKSNFALGLNGEAGELGDLVKKNVHHGHEFNREKFVGEVGDVLWYLSALCSTYNISLEECATMNLHKLGKRYANGFSKEASIARVDVKA